MIFIGDMKDYLTNSERETLRSQHRRERNRRVGDRIKAILLSDKGWSYRQIAEVLLLDEQTVSRHVDEYRDSKKLTIESGGSESRLDEVQTTLLSAHLERFTYPHIGDICTYVRIAYGVSYSFKGMTSWMHNHGFSYKKPKGTPAKADLKKQEAFIREYEDLMSFTFEDEPILFGDGVHPTMSTKITYGWIKTGTDKLIATTASRTRLNIMGSLNLETMEVIANENKTLDSDAMKVHFEKLRQHYPTAPKIHLILDNGSYNKSFETKEAAKKCCIVLHYLPPYSPNLNPIERLWKVMNEKARNGIFFESAKEFRQSIMEFFDVTWPKIAMSMTDRINDNFQLLKSIV
jgi:transposase